VTTDPLVAQMLDLIAAIQARRARAYLLTTDLLAEWPPRRVAESQPVADSQPVPTGGKEIEP